MIPKDIISEVRALEVTGVPLRGASVNCAPAPCSAPACKPGCGHTVQEHTAFDHGLRDGEEGQADSENPYRAHDLREAWATGHSVGVLNRQAESGITKS